MHHVGQEDGDAPSKSKTKMPACKSGKSSSKKLFEEACCDELGNALKAKKKMKHVMHEKMRALGVSSRCKTNGMAALSGKEGAEHEKAGCLCMYTTAVICATACTTALLMMFIRR